MNLKKLKINHELFGWVHFFDNSSRIEYKK